MINAWWLVLIVPLSALIGFISCALLVGNREASRTYEEIMEDDPWMN